MKNLKLYGALFVILLMLVGGFVVPKLTNEISRLKGNQDALLMNQKITENERFALEMNNKEMASLIESDAQMMTVLYDSLDLQAKQIEQFAKLSSMTHVKVVTELKDTTIYVPETDTFYVAKAVEWSDNWASVTGLISELPSGKEKLELDLILPDTIFYTSAGIKYKKFFVSRWFEKPTIVTKIWNANPYVNIRVERVIIKEED